MTKADTSRGFLVARPSGPPARLGERLTSMERVRREIVLGNRFDEADFAAAFQSFRKLYNTEPQRILAAPDVLTRFCELFARGADASHVRIVAYEGVPLTAAILAAGTIAIEGEVSEDRMGDW